jgi:pimeloyl-ACP methyl ester carboxylesterase
MRSESRSEYVAVRGLRHHVRHWGSPGAPPLFMLHGWMDVSASFQFVVDALTRDWHVIAPDWRGFGLSEWTRQPYWFPDYLADLDHLLRHYSPEEPCWLVAHSMGGNVAMLYAGVRPSRVRGVVNLEGFGLSATHAEQAPDRYAKWLDQIDEVPGFKAYPDLASLAARLMEDNPRLTRERAEFLAPHLGGETRPGRVERRADPRHRWTNPVLYRLDEVAACWRRIRAPVLWVAGEDSRIVHEFAGRPGDYAARLAAVPDVLERRIADCGHMLHHDRPEVVASLIEEFVQRTGQRARAAAAPAEPFVIGGEDSDG